MSISKKSSTDNNPPAPFPSTQAPCSIYIRQATLHKRRPPSAPLSTFAPLPMFEGLLLLIDVRVWGKSVDIQAHVPGNATVSSLGKAGFGVDDRVATLGSLHELRILLFENSKVLLGLPVPDAVRREEKVHFLEGALIRLGIQAVDHGQRDDVGNTEDVICLLLESFKDDGKDECQPTVADRPANDTPSITLSPDFQRENLSWVKPWNGEPGGAEGGGEEKDHRNSTRAVSSSKRRSSWMLETSSGETTGEEHGDALNN